MTRLDSISERPPKEDVALPCTKDGATDGSSAVALLPRPLDLVAMLCGAGASLFVLGATLAGLLAAMWWIVAVVIVRSDIERYIIPDAAVAAVAFLGLADSLLMPDWQFSLSLGALACGACTFLLFWLIGAIYHRRTGRLGLGFGDVKLAGASAVWLSPGDMALAVEIAAVAAAGSLLFGRNPAQARGSVAIPFGAFLAPAAWLVFVGAPFVAAIAERLP